MSADADAFEVLMAQVSDLSATVLRVKSERDRALQLLREAYRRSNGTWGQAEFRGQIRKFLESLADCPECGSIEVESRSLLAGDSALTDTFWRQCVDCGARWGVN